MPQITLKFSANIKGKIASETLELIFRKINSLLKETIPDIDIPSCNSGVIFEEFSYMNNGDPTLAKCYYELLWLENDQRIPLKSLLAEKILKLLEEELIPQLEKHGLSCAPRVRISNLGVLGKDYFISKRVPAI